MASFFMPKSSHSTAATAHLNSSSSSKPNKKDSPSRRHRRLASDVWLDTLGDDNSLNNKEEEEANSTNYDTKSTSFSSSSNESDDDSDDEYDSDDDDTNMSNNNNGSVTGSMNDALSVTSGSTSYSDMLLHSSELSYYDDGDLHTLNSLVNKLHAAELKREVSCLCVVCIVLNIVYVAGILFCVCVYFVVHFIFCVCIFCVCLRILK